ncbi:MAG: hypothetical protein WC867_05880 [Candidatus Pacearchaeota archaeon]|jgi:hypothetical protein
MGLLNLLDPIRKYNFKKEIISVVNENYEGANFHKIGLNYTADAILKTKSKKIPYTLELFCSDLEIVKYPSEEFFDIGKYDLSSLIRTTNLPEGFLALSVAEIKSPTYESRMAIYQEKIKQFEEEASKNPHKNPFFSSEIFEEYQYFLGYYDSLDINELKLEEPIECPACGGLGNYSADWKCKLCLGNGNLSAEKFKESYKPTLSKNSIIQEYIPTEIAAEILAFERGIFSPEPFSQIFVRINTH